MPAIVAMVGIFQPSHTFASGEPGISITVYNNFGYNASPPLPEISGRPEVGSSAVLNINQNFDQSPLFGMYEDFIVKYEGYITSPITGQIHFWPHADDGTKFYLDNQLIDDGNWVDKGGGGYQTEPQDFVEGVSRQFTYWYYENGGGANTTLYWDIGNGWEIVPASAFTMTPQTTTTTTTAPYLNEPESIEYSFGNDGSVTISWTPGQQSNIDPYIWNISWYEMDSGEPSGGWGIWVYADTLSSILPIDPSNSGFGITRVTVSAGTAPCIGEGDGICLYGPSSYVDINILPPSTTTTTTTSTTTSSTTSTTTTTVVDVVQPNEELQETPQIPTPHQESEKPQSPKSPSTTMPKAETGAETQTSTAVEQKEEISPLNVTTTTISTIPQTTTTLVTVDTIFENIEQLSQEELKDIAMDSEALLLISATDAKEIFKSIDDDSLTESEALAIIDAVQSAPNEIRETFEDSVDLFGGAFDSYEMVGQTISVGERRTMVAVNLVTATVAATAVAGGLSGSTGGGEGGPSGGGGNGGNPTAARKNEEQEQEQEMAGEIAGDGYDWVSKLSIYKTIDEERVLDWKAFIKKFWLGVMNLGFTIAGSVVVYFTLSGSIQKIALVSTILAFASAMYIHMKEPD